MVLITVSHKLNTDEKTHLLFSINRVGAYYFNRLKHSADKKIRYILPMIPALAIISVIYFMLRMKLNI